MKVKELMSAPVEWVHPSLPIREAARKMRASNVGCIPVCEERRLFGILTDRDIVCRLVANGGNADRMHVYDLMTGNVVACLEDQDAREAAEIMRAKALRRLPVLDRQRWVVGLISVDDLYGSIPDDMFAATIQAIIKAHHGPAGPVASPPSPRSVP
jgi:CBS domain-containing protein